jgi:antitoxin HicB
MTNDHFSVVLEPDREEPHRYNVRVPALPGCLTYGESVDDALANAREAIAGYVESRIAHGARVQLDEHSVIATTVTISTAEAA